MSKKLNKTYADLQVKGSDALIEKGKYNSGTAHVAFDASAIVYPEGMNEEGLVKYVDFANNLPGQVEVATQHFAHKAYGEDDKIETVTGSLRVGSLEITSSHHLRQEVGDDHLYGTATTISDYHFSPEQNAYLDDVRSHSADLARKLFASE